MKKLIFLLIALFALIPLFGQEMPEIPDWTFLYENFGVLLGTYLGIAAVASFLSEYVIRLLKLVAKAWKVIVVVVLAVALSFLGNLINLGYLAEATWWETIIWGGLSGAVAAGLRSGNILFFKSVVDFVIGYLKSKEPTA